MLGKSHKSARGLKCKDDSSSSSSRRLRRLSVADIALRRLCSVAMHYPSKWAVKERECMDRPSGQKIVAVSGGSTIVLT